MPVTYEIIGCHTKMLGVKISVYNLQKNREKGLFLTCDDYGWLFENKILTKNAHHIYLEGLPLSNYFLCHIFEYIVVPFL